MGGEGRVLTVRKRSIECAAVMGKILGCKLKERALEQRVSKQELSSSSRVARWQWKVLWILAVVGVAGSVWFSRRVRNGGESVVWLGEGGIPKRWRDEIQAMARVNQDFGLDRLVTIAIQSPVSQDVLSADLIALNQALTKALGKMAAVQRVISLPSSLSISVEQRTMVVRKLFPEKLSLYTPEAAKRLRELMGRDPLFRGTLFSPDGRVAVTIAVLKEGLEQAKRQAFAVELLGVLDQIHGLAPEARFGLGGQPMIETLMQRSFWRESPWLYPMALATFVFVLLCLMRSWRVLLWWLLWSLASGVSLGGLLWWVFGGGHPAWVIAPLLWFWVGLMWSVEYVVAERLSREDYEAARRYVRSLRVALLSAGVVMAGASLLWSVWGWGLIAEAALVGLLSLCVLTLFAWMLWPRPPGTSAERRGEASRPSEVLLEEPAGLGEEERAEWMLRGDRVAQWMYRRRRVWWGVTIAVVCVAGMGCWRIQWGRELVGYLPAHGLLAEGEKMMREHLGGATPLIVRMEGDLRHPAVLRGMERASRRMEVDPQIAHPQSIAGLIRHLHRVMKGSPRIPNERKQIEALWVLLEGQPALATLLRKEGRDGILQARLRLEGRLSDLDLSARIDGYLEAIPRQVESVVWEKLSIEQRRLLVQERARWVAEGVSLWSRRLGGPALDADIEARLVAVFLSSIQEAQRADWSVPSSYRLRMLLQRYLQSEGCDIELPRALQEKVLEAWVSALPKGQRITAERVESAMRRALTGSEAARDKDGIRYATASVVQRLVAQSRAFQREQLVDRVLREVKAQPEFLRSGLGEALAAGGKRAAALLRALEAELFVVQDPHWFRTDRGAGVVRLTHTGLHRFWLPMIEWVRDLIWPLFGGMVLWVWLLVWLLWRSGVDAWKVVWPLVLTALVLMGWMGWFGIALDGVTLLLWFTVLLFCIFGWVRLRYASRAVRRALARELPLSGVRIAPVVAALTQQTILFLTPLLFLCFSVIPVLFEVGWMFGVGMFFAVWMGIGTLFSDLRPRAKAGITSETSDIM